MTTDDEQGTLASMPEIPPSTPTIEVLWAMLGISKKALYSVKGAAKWSETALQAENFDVEHIRNMMALIITSSERLEMFNGKVKTYLDKIIEESK